MSKSLRYLHVYNRGVSGELIFRSPANYLFLLQRLKQYVPVYSVRVVAYCLMPTHYHFLFGTEEKVNVSRLVQRLFNSYTRAFNRQHERTGTLFEGRAKTKVVGTDEYILQLCRYIHFNPVESNLVKDPGEWKYSNYSEWINKRDGELVDGEFIATYFRNPAEYEDFGKSLAKGKNPSQGVSVPAR